MRIACATIALLALLASAKLPLPEPSTPRGRSLVDPGGLLTTPEDCRCASEVTLATANEPVPKGSGEVLGPNLLGGFSIDNSVHDNFLHDDFSYDDRAHWHAHGQQVCKSGCAVSNHPTLDLTAAEYRRLIGEYASAPVDENGPAFEALLYYGKQTRDLVTSEGASPLDGPHLRRLMRELSRAHVRVSCRIVDADGCRRVWLPPTRVPLDRRHVFTMETVDLQPLVTSGTVKRVGQDYLWVRL